MTRPAGVRPLLCLGAALALSLTSSVVVSGPAAATGCTTGAGVFDGGTGTAEDPYQVATASQLASVGVINYLSCSFRQTADIVLSGEWTPIGTSSLPFQGTYDGDHRAVTGLSITDSAFFNRGLFGYADAGATIASLAVTGSVTGTGSAYGLVVGRSLGTLRDVTAAGTVTVAAPGSVAGGVAGRAEGTVLRASSSATVTAPSVVGGLVGAARLASISGSVSSGPVTGSGAYTGGLVGMADGTQIVSSYSTSPTSGGDDVGGLVGILRKDGSFASGVTGSYATGAVTQSGVGTASAGGLVGLVSGSSVTDSFASGSVTGVFYVGGLVGFTVVPAAFTDVYARGAVSAPDSPSSAGGLIAYPAAGTLVVDGFWDTQTSGQAASTCADSVLCGTGRTTEQMKSYATYTTAPVDWSMFDGYEPEPAGKVWGICSTTGYPFLRALTPSTPCMALSADPAAIPVSGDFVQGDTAVVTVSTSPSASTTIDAEVTSGASSVDASPASSVGATADITLTAKTAGSATVTYTAADHLPATTSVTVTALSITGAAVDVTSPSAGDLLTATATANAGTRTYQWQADTGLGGAYEDIAGAATATYTVPGALVGRRVRVVATATNGTVPFRYAASDTSAATEPVATGPARTPTLGAPTPAAGGFTVAVTNYDPAWTWTPSVDAGTVTAGIPSGSTLPLSVTGLAAAQAATVTVTASRSGYGTGSAQVRGTAAPAPDPTPSPTPPSPTPTPPDPTPTPTAPAPSPVDLRPGQGQVVVGGVTVPATVAPGPGRREVRISGGGVDLRFLSRAPDGRALPLARDGSLTLVPRGRLSVRGSGFRAATDASLFLFSDPLRLGALPIAADGSLQDTVDVPGSVPVGDHVLQATALTSGREPVAVSLGVRVVRRVPQVPVRALDWPRRLHSAGWTRVLSVPVRTNAGSTAAVRVTCTRRARGLVPSGDVTIDRGGRCRVRRSGGAVRVWLPGDRATQVRVRVHAGPEPGFTSYTRVRVYRTRSVR